MLNLTTAIYGKLSGSALAGHIANRLFKGRAPEGTDYPYAVFFVVSDSPIKTFTENFEDVLIQFSLFSATSGTTEVENMFTDLKTLYDECAMTIINTTWFHWMRRQNATLIADDVTTPAGTIQVWHYIVDYELMILGTT